MDELKRLQEQDDAAAVAAKLAGSDIERRLKLQEPPAPYGVFLANQPGVENIAGFLKAIGRRGASELEVEFISHHGSGRPGRRGRLVARWTYLGWYIGGGRDALHPSRGPFNGIFLCTDGQLRTRLFGEVDGPLRFGVPTRVLCAGYAPISVGTVVVPGGYVGPHAEDWSPAPLASVLYGLLKTANVRI